MASSLIHRPLSKSEPISSAFSSAVVSLSRSCKRLFISFASSLFGLCISLITFLLSAFPAVDTVAGSLWRTCLKTASVCGLQKYVSKELNFGGCSLRLPQSVEATVDTTKYLLYAGKEKEAFNIPYANMAAAN